MTDTTEKTATDDDDPSARPPNAATETDTDSGSEKTGSEPGSRVLEELDQHIRAARASAEEALGDPEHTFVESGDAQSESLDDQTIAPG